MPYIYIYSMTLCYAKSPLGYCACIPFGGHAYLGVSQQL